MKREKEILSDLESSLWIQVSVYTWIVKQAVGLFLKEKCIGSRQEFVRSQFNGSHLDCIRTNAFGVIPVSSFEG